MSLKVNGVKIAGYGAPGKDGSPGKSAYEAAKEAGYTGTEQEFNALLYIIDAHASRHEAGGADALDLSKLAGVLPIEKGGTGVTSNPSMLINLSSGSAESVFTASPRPGVTGALPVENGGTGATSVSAALEALGVPSAITSAITEGGYSKIECGVYEGASTNSGSTNKSKTMEFDGYPLAIIIAHHGYRPSTSGSNDHGNNAILVRETAHYMIIGGQNALDTGEKELEVTWGDTSITLRGTYACLGLDVSANMYGYIAILR